MSLLILILPNSTLFKQKKTIESFSKMSGYNFNEGGGGRSKPYVIIKGGFSQSLRSLTEVEGGSKMEKNALRNLWTAP